MIILIIAVNAFMPHFNPNCRIVNITSNMAHHSAGTSQEEILLRKNLDEKFTKIKTMYELDGFLRAFQTDVMMGTWRENEWPSCAYSVSKMAINAYTRQVINSEPTDFLMQNFRVEYFRNS